MIKIPIAKPYFTDIEKKAVLKVIDSGWFTQGVMVNKFEEAVAKYIQAKYAVATTSCTTALHLSLIALGVTKGDEIILPSFTFIATANAIEYVGAKPVFCDIDLNTFNIDVNQIRSLVTRRTRAILPVHLFGLCADMKPILDIAKEYRLFIVEDAACSLGALYRNKHAGTLGNIGCFSFHPRKSITTGEGGIAVSNNHRLFSKLCLLRNHGASKSDLSRHKGKGWLLPSFDILGFNFRMTDIQGAMGFWQMKRIDSIVKARQKRAEQYNIALDNLEWLKTPYVPEGCKHVYQSYVCRINKNFFGDNIAQANKFRNRLMENLENKGIATRQGTHAVHMLGFYKEKYGYEHMDFPRAFEADRLSIALPLYPNMSDFQQKYVINNIISLGRRLLRRQFAVPTKTKYKI